MSKKSKRVKEFADQIDETTRFSVEDGVAKVKEFAKVKFDETVDAAIKLGVDPRKSDQMVRGAVSLPHGLGKEIRVLVFATGDKEQEAKDAGADFVGSDDLVEKIQGGWTDFDAAIATPPMMAKVGRIGKILGPRGLMPNPKTGTVTMDVAKAVHDAKGGKVQYKVEKAGIVHAPIGKASFSAEKLVDNFMMLVDDINRQKPSSAKGTYIQSATVSSTMGPGVKLDTSALKSTKKG